MDVKLNNFVTIELAKHEYATINGTRDTAVLINFQDLTSSGTTKIRTETGYFVDKKVFTKSDYTALKEIANQTDEEKLLLKYFRNFFDNGGVNLKLLHTKILVSGEARGLANTVKEIEMKEIVIFACGLADYDDSAGATTPNEKTLLDLLTGTGIYQKIFIGRIDTAATLSTYTIQDKEFYVKKYGTAGVEGTVAAYLTKINIAGSDTAKDYCFTKETMATADIFGDEVISYIMDDDDPMHFNADCTLVNTVRNIGGNDCSGYSIINQFMLICLYQTLTQRLVNTLAKKIKFDSQGIGLIMTAIDLEMNRYINNGYITTNKIYDDEDLIWNKQTVLHAGEQLLNGYKALMATYTSEDLVNHKFPGIYLVLADQYAIRKISITGEVF